MARYAGAFAPPTTPYPGPRQDNPRVTYQFEDPDFRAGLAGITDETGQRTNGWAYDSDTLSQHGGVVASAADKKGAVPNPARASLS